ncbi:polymorphic toxin-type HINT domain-containing protein, partial [Singulisphaera rosea]
LGLYQGYSPLLGILVCGRLIRTTAKHPFWVQGRGWTDAQHLKIGDHLRTHLGRSVVVESLEYELNSTTVYNFEVEEYHTYFIGKESWDFSVWSHNDPLKILNPCFVPMNAAPSKGISRFPEWKAGDPITKLTPEGNYPSWQAIRERYWQNRAASAMPGEFGPSNIGAMRQGAAPSARVLVRDNATGQIREIRAVKELHHARGGRGVPDYDTPRDLREVWPWEHAAIDPSRRLDYTFFGFR